MNLRPDVNVEQVLEIGIREYLAVALSFSFPAQIKV